MAPRFEPVVLALACAGIVAGYFWISYPAIPQYGLLEPSQQHFNQLVAGFRSGQLSLKQAPPVELTKLADPYDPNQNAPYRLHDASYYGGKYYLYYGITPALILFWPYVAVTGTYLPQKYAVTTFCSVGFLIGALLVWQIRRRCFQKPGTGVVLAMVVAVGTVNGAAFLVRRPEMYEVSISCAYAMVMAALASLWCALDGRRPVVWTALSSLFFGLAVGARPTFLFGTASLLIPVAFLLKAPEGVHDRKNYRRKLGMAAFAPLLSVGIGLAIYNYLRFGNPLEFGIKYTLMGEKFTRFFAFDWQIIWLIVRLYFLLPTRLMEYFPFVRGVDVSAVASHGTFAENPFGVLTNMPFLLLACAAPLAWLPLMSGSARRLRLFACAVAWVFLGSVGVLLVFAVGTGIRYEVDFIPYLAILAVLGVFGIEDFFSTRPNGRGLARLGWAGALAVSIAFNFFASCQHHGVLKRDAPGEFQALSRFFNYPIYTYNRFLASVRASPRPTEAPTDASSSHERGPLLVRIRLPPGIVGLREPLLAIGSGPGGSVVAFIRTVSRDQIAVGFELPGPSLYECRPISVKQQDTIDVAIFEPNLLPDLGDPEWKGVPYLKQLSDLGLYAITVNGAMALEGNSAVDGPIDRNAPLSIGVNPLKDSIVGARFTGQIMGISRLDVSHALLAQ
jgi:hypothetical protein